MSSNNGDYAIDLHNVEKVYKGRIRALCGVEMRVHRGEIFGLLGPNGAGKSTLVKIMMTVVRPTKATGTLLGSPLRHKPTLAKVGYLPEHHKMPRYLTGSQVLHYYAALARVPKAERKKRAGELLDTVGMTEWAKTPIGSYSKGMQQRIGLAQALMNDPDLVVLDEPTDGVDPVGRRDIRDVLVRMRDQGRTVLLNSHLLSELEMVCGRVAILVQGIVRMQGSLEDLTADSRRYDVVIAGGAPEWTGTYDSLRATPVAEDKTKLTLHGADPQPVQPLLDRLRQDDRTILSVQPVRESLEDLFMRAIQDPSTGSELKPGATKGRKP